MTAVSELEPKALWNNFLKICAIPHGSGNEAGIRAMLLAWAKEQGFAGESDKTGNVYINVPATAGYETAPAVILQGHMDMVCEKESGVDFDFLKDGIKAIVAGDVVTADGTTLGADDGIGVATAMAIATDKNLVHGPLELIFTVDEETGLTGANGIDASKINGDLLLNLDSEELGFITVGCAGAGSADITLPISFEDAPAGYTFCKLVLDGLKGGHSGLDIALQRGNAIVLLARFINRLPAEFATRLVAITGGDKHNAIPRSAEAVIAIKGSVKDVAALAEKFPSTVVTELAKGHSLAVSCSETAAAKVLSAELTAKVINLVLAVPHGPLANSLEVTGLVQTSNNLAVVRTNNDNFVIKCSPRSAVDAELVTVLEQIGSIGKLAGAKVDLVVNYPGWKPDADSKLLATALAVSKDMFGKAWEVAAIHAGLECGILGAMKPSLDKISIGPDLKSPHSPDESVGIESVKKFYEFLTALVAKIAAGN